MCDLVFNGPRKRGRLRVMVRGARDLLRYLRGRESEDALLALVQGHKGTVALSAIVPAEDEDDSPSWSATFNFQEGVPKGFRAALRTWLRDGVRKFSQQTPGLCRLTALDARRDVLRSAAGALMVHGETRSA